jgi:hypothetical protein
MATVTFDTFENVQRLKAVGFTEEQAAEQTKIISELIENRLSTKQDLKELEMRLTLRLGCMMAASIAIVAALVKLL